LAEQSTGGSRRHSVLWRFVGFAGVVAVYLASAALRDDSMSLRLLSQVAYLAPFVACTIACLRASAATPAAERRFWSMLSVAGALILAAEIQASYLVLANVSLTQDTGVQPILYGVAALAYIGVVVSLLRFPVDGGPARIRRVIDGVAVALLAYAVVLRVLTAVASPQDAAGLSATPLMTSAYVVIGAVILFVTIYARRGGNLTHWPRWEQLVTNGVSVYSIGVVLWPLWMFGQSSATPVASRVVELIWMGGQTLVLFGAIDRLMPAWKNSFLAILPRLAPVRHLGAHLAVTVLVTVGAPVAAFFAVSSAADTIERVAYTAVAVTLAVLLVVRAALVTFDNTRLFGSSMRDKVTGLCRNEYFHERLEAEVELARRSSAPLGLLIFDVNDLRVVNSVFGREKGDELLRAVADRLKTALDHADTPCHLGADRFGVVALGADGRSLRQRSIALKVAIAEGLAPLGIPASVSIGEALMPEHGSDAASLLRAADTAWQWGRSRGRGEIVRYDPSVMAQGPPVEERGEERDRLALLEAVATAVDRREPGAESHSVRVAALAVMLGRGLGLDEERLGSLRLAARLHDLGKIGVPESVFSKRGPLTSEEWGAIHAHPVLGERAVSSGGVPSILPWIRHHHERWDGAGYPDRLAADAIPLEARIITIADAYDAMTSERAYRRPLSSRAALQEIDLGMGGQFDPGLAETFIRLVNASDTLGGADLHL
jgi:diguanylate cyclase (GGDEF)-like protein